MCNAQLPAWRCFCFMYWFVHFAVYTHTLMHTPEPGNTVSLEMS